MKFYSLAVFTVLLLSGSITSHGAEEGINPFPLSKERLSSLLSKHFPSDSMSLSSIEECVAVTKNPRNMEHYKEKADKLDPDDEVFMNCHEGALVGVVLAETGGVPHSLRIVFPIVNYGEEQQEKVFSFLKEVSQAFFPEWEGAEMWPIESLIAAWERSAIVDREAALKNPDRVFERHSEGDLTSTVYGVPPDIVVYDFSIKERCKQKVGMKNPFKRFIC